ncbi:hypothetical protein Q1695_010828 [Nippostrongylus brasiliensis]|nr:hypothetical protein Q1695_010828 [Nippostrongylus brasiliensis]
MNKDDRNAPKSQYARGPFADNAGKPQYEMSEQPKPDEGTKTAGEPTPKQDEGTKTAGEPTPMVKGLLARFRQRHQHCCRANTKGGMDYYSMYVNKLCNFVLLQDEGTKTAGEPTPMDEGTKTAGEPTPMVKEIILEVDEGTKTAGEPTPMVKEIILEVVRK